MSNILFVYLPLPISSLWVFIIPLLLIFYLKLHNWSHQIIHVTTLHYDTWIKFVDCRYNYIDNEHCSSTKIRRELYAPRCPVNDAISLRMLARGMLVRREKGPEIVFSPERAFRCGRKLAALIPRGQTMGANRKNVAAKPRRARAKTISSSFTGP